MAKYQTQGVHNSKLPSHPQLPKVSVGPAIFGQAVHALIENDVSMVDLQTQGLSLQIAEPNLEDVFVTLARQQAIKVGLK